MLRGIEGFDWLPANAGSPTSIMGLLAHNACYNPYNFADPQWRTLPGRFGGNCLWQNQNGLYSHSSWTVFLPRTAVTMQEGRLGIAIWRDYATGGNPVFCVYDAANTAPQISVEFGSMGVIRVWRGEVGSGTLLVSTPAGTYFNDTWLYCELGYKIDPSVGYVTVKVNAGVPAHLDGIVVNLTSANTQNTGRNVCDSYGIGRRDEGVGVSIASYLFDDIYWADRTGTYNTDYLGNVRVQMMSSSGPGPITQLSIGGSSPLPANWQNVQDWWTDEAQYVYAPYVGGAGFYDLYAMNPIVNQGTIFGIQLRSAMRQDDATQIEGGNVLKSGATTYYGAPALMNETYSYIKDILETDPNTSTGFVYSNLNAVYMGPQRVA
jgi:hypothetical protein